MAFVIPVIDLLGGQVVRAVRGERRNYRAIESALCAGSEPLQVARALLAHCNSPCLYIADLDALQGGVRQIGLVQRLLQALPTTEFWVDAGFADAAQAQALCEQVGADAARMVPVFGSESLPSKDALQACFAPAAAHGTRAVLSLDRRDGQRLDAAGCWDAPALWPQRVIVMTLERVGSDAGPDLETIAQVRRKAPGATVIGAGGIRHAADLDAAKAAGADAWLVASALHDRRL
jgi:phosphoribosyl isomerase A